MSGNFQESSRLMTQLLGDDQISQCLDTRIEPILSLFSDPKNIEITPADNSSTARFVCEWWRPRVMAYEAIKLIDLRSSLEEACMVGFSVKQIVYGEGDQNLPRWDRTPRLDRWPLGGVRYIESMRSWQTNTYNDGTIYIHPEGGAWQVFSPHDHYQCWARGAIRNLATLWLVKKYALRDWSKYATSYGNLLKVLQVPMMASDGQKQSVIDALKDLKAESVIPVPVGREPGTSFDFKVVAPPAGTADVFLKLAQHCDTRVATHLLGQDSTTQMKGGAYNAVEGLIDQVLLGKTRLDMAFVNTVLFPSYFRNTTRLLFGSDRLAPVVRIKTQSLQSAPAPQPPLESQKPIGTKPMPFALSIRTFAEISAEGKRKALCLALDSAFEDRGGIPPRAADMFRELHLAIDSRLVNGDEFDQILAFAFDPDQPRDEFGKFVSAGKAGNERYRKLSDTEHEELARTAQLATGEHKDAADRAMAAIKKNRFGDARWLLEDLRTKGGIPKTENQMFVDEHEARHRGTYDKVSKYMDTPAFELLKEVKRNEWAEQDAAKPRAEDSLRAEWHDPKHADHPTHSTITVERTYPGRGKPDWTQYKQTQVPHAEANTILDAHKGFAAAANKAKVTIYRNGEPIAVKEPLGKLQAVGVGRFVTPKPTPLVTGDPVKALVDKVQAAANAPKAEPAKKTLTEQLDEVQGKIKTDREKRKAERDARIAESKTPEAVAKASEKLEQMRSKPASTEPAPTHYKIDHEKIQQEIDRRNHPDIKRQDMEAHGATTHAELRIVPLHEIERKPVWNQGRIDSIHEGIKSGNTLPPVHLGEKKGGGYEIEDGIHRVNASHEQGFTHVPAIVENWTRKAAARKGAEKKAENNQRVESDIPEHLQSYWNKVKGGFKGTSDQRREQFEEHIQSHKAQVDAHNAEQADKAGKKLEREQAKYYREQAAEVKAKKLLGHDGAPVPFNIEPTEDK
jgi:hypothetical protein